MTARVFVSYAGSDSNHARKLTNGLVEAGHDVFFAPANLRGGDVIPETLEHEIKTRDALVLIATNHATQSPFVLAEVASAFRNRKRILLVRFNSYTGHRSIDFMTGSAVWISARNNVSSDVIASVNEGLHQLRMPGAIIPVLNLKGGTGKTTFCANVFAAMSEVLPQPVLMIDLDPQHNLSQLLISNLRATNASDEGRTVLSLFEPSPISSPPSTNPASSFEINYAADWEIDEARIAERPPLGHGPSIAIVPGQFLATKYALSRDGDRVATAIENFDRNLKSLQRRFPIIVIDVNPSASALTEAALSAATHIVTPIMPNVHAYSGAKLLCQFLRATNRSNLVDKIIPVLNGFGRAQAAAFENQLRSAVRDHPNFGARCLRQELAYSDYLRPRNDDPQGLGYLRNSRVGANVRAVANELMEALRQNASEGTEPRRATG